MKEHEFWKERRHLEEMPFDKCFDVDGNSELCHATGYEVFDGEDWWDEFVDSNGDFQYGRWLREAILPAEFLQAKFKQGLIFYPTDVYYKKKEIE